jgi:hypothetical protein
MMNDLNNTQYILDFNFSIPKELENNFQGIFSYIKKKYQIKFSRKSHIDSLLKKCKGKFFKTIHEIMNRSLNIIVKRLPQKFITNITIEYNRKYLKKNIIEIYQDFNLLPDYHTMVEKGLIKTNRKEAFSEFCSYELTQLYNIYIDSQRYCKEIDDVKNQDGRRIGLLYQFVSKNFCAYFENNKPHCTKIKEEIINHANNINISNDDNCKCKIGLNGNNKNNSTDFDEHNNDKDDKIL